jgi:restriction system protein
MSRRNPPGIEKLLLAPWQTSAVLSVATFAVLRWILPYFTSGNAIAHPIAVRLIPFAFVAALMFGISAIASALLVKRRHALLDRQTSLESLRSLTWQQFESLVGVAFQRQGYRVVESATEGPDGGVDHLLQKDGQTTVVQCKQWRVYSVGVSVVRELFGVMTAEHADNAIVITSGRFTGDARAFAKGKPITLIDGRALLELVKGVQTVSTTNASTASSAQACPRCGAPMIERIARRGPTPGKPFLGCSTYPKCTETVSLE